MKKVFALLFCLFVLPLTSKADEDTRFCLVSGNVLLQVQTDSVTGHIGEQPITLTRYQNLMYGEINGLETTLRFYGQHVVGTIGTADIHWTFNRGGFITGNQECIAAPVVPTPMPVTPTPPRYPHPIFPLPGEGKPVKP